uniref:Sushi domain-containing protein n=1 Tax=Heterorhabditis bacteriophora TaxID=37862 RepID=A0A1I7X4S8_HETBA
MNIGSERLKGKNEVVCRSGTWSHAVPFCVPLDPLNRNKDSPPILFDVVGGPYSISPTGELIVGRSATVSFSCFFPRKMGKVRWEVSSTYRSYSQIWTKLKALGIDKTDAYQLTVAVAQPEDSGLLHCIIPSGKRHTIKMRVDEGSCQPQQNSSHLYVYFTRRNFFIGTVAQFSCPSGFRIHGYTTSTCQADGTWTHPPPKCYGRACYNNHYIEIKFKSNW